MLGRCLAVSRSCRRTECQSWGQRQGLTLTIWESSHHQKRVARAHKTEGPRDGLGVRDAWLHFSKYGQQCCSYFCVHLGLTTSRSDTIHPYRRETTSQRPILGSPVNRGTHNS